MKQSECEELCSLEVHQLQTEVFIAFLNTELGHYLLKFLDVVLNLLPFTAHQLEKMTEKQLDLYIVTVSNLENTKSILYTYQQKMTQCSSEFEEQSAHIATFVEIMAQSLGLPILKTLT